MNPSPSHDASKRQEPAVPIEAPAKDLHRKSRGIDMNRHANRFSLPAAAIAAVVALSVTGGVAALFQSRAGIAEPSVYTLAARVPAQSLPMREVVPNRVDVLGVRDAQRMSGIARSVRPNDRS